MGEQRHTDVVNTTSDDEHIKRELEKHSPGTSLMSWSLAVKVIENVLGVCSHLPNGSGQGKRGHAESMVHVPLMERSKGTTYEEKVRSVLGDGRGEGKPEKSTKKRDRYE